MSVSQEEFRSPGRTVNQEAGEHGTKLVLLGSTLGKGTDLSYALRAGRREWSHLECWDFVYFCGLRQKPYNPLPSLFLTWITAEKGHLLVEHSHFPPYIWSSHLSSSLSSSATLQDMVSEWPSHTEPSLVLARFSLPKSPLLLFSLVQISQASETFGYKVTWLLTFTFNSIPAKIRLHADWEFLQLPYVFLGISSKCLMSLKLSECQCGCRDRKNAPFFVLCQTIPPREISNSRFHGAPQGKWVFPRQSLASLRYQLRFNVWTGPRTLGHSILPLPQHHVPHQYESRKLSPPNE